MPRSRSLPAEWTAADLLKQVGDVAPYRIRLNPPPGMATEKDVIRIHDREGRLYELVDSTLVEKPTGALESCLAGLLIRLLGTFVDQHDLCFSPDGHRLASASDDGTVKVWDATPVSEPAPEKPAAPGP